MIRLIGAGVVLLLILLIVPQAIRIIREYQRILVFRLGRALKTKGPGLVILIPFIDKGVLVDLRELYLEIPHQTADHEGQRHDLDRLHRLLQGDRRSDVGDRGRQLRRCPQNIASICIYLFNKFVFCKNKN